MALTRQEMEIIAQKEKERRLNISRVPTPTKELFIQWANEEFAGDYGLLLKFLTEQTLEYQHLKSLFLSNIDFKLDSILNKLNSYEKESPKLGTFGDRRRELKGGKE